LAENWESIDIKVNPHSLALVTYALHLALHPAKDQVLFLKFVECWHQYNLFTQYDSAKTKLLIIMALQDKVSIFFIKHFTKL
jgi:hypothetical protein